MICVFGPTATDFTTLGLGALAPSSCTVTETLNGEWELTLIHPIDENGKWTRLQYGNIVKAPVPAAPTPRVRMISQADGRIIYRVSTQVDPLNLRSGPGTSYSWIATYRKGTEVVLVSKTNDDWYEVICPDGRRGYMSTQYLTYAESIEEMDQGVLEALKASGASYWQIVFQCIVPSSIRYMLAWTFLRFEINFTNAIAMGAAAGAGGIGYNLFMAGGFYFDLREMGFLTYVVVLAVIVLEMAATKIKAKVS